MTTSGSGSGSTEQLASTANKPLPSVSVDPPIRSAPQARALSEDTIETLRDLPYREYLRTAWWYSRRNQALREAGYRCQKCASKRELQVHHASYQRLGCEQPQDLVVVCRGCHLGHHRNETQDGIGIYARVLSDTIQSLPNAEFSDVIEEAKQRCAKLKIHIDPDRFNAAVARVNSRISFRAPEAKRELYEESAEGQPLTKAEAAGALAKLGVAQLMRHIPQVTPLTERQAARIKALRIIVEAIAEQTQRCDDAESGKVF